LGIPLREPLPLSLLAEWVGGQIVGDEQTLIKGVSEIEQAREGDLVFAWTKTFAQSAFASRAAAVVTSPEFQRETKPCLLVDNPRLAMALLLERLFPAPSFPAFVSPKASIAEGVQLGEGVFIGDFSVIGEGSVIGDGTVIFPHAYIGRNVVIGAHCRIHPFAVLHDGVFVGNRVIIHAGAVIGREGFGFVWDGERHRRIPQVGTVVLEDEVEIGAHACIDRATLGETRIGQGTKIDNLVQIAHNCRLGAHCLLAGQVGLAGGVQVGNGVLMGGQVGVADHRRIGDEVRLAAKTGLIDDAPNKSQWGGYPARPHAQWLRIEAALSELPDALRLLRQLAQRVEALEKRRGAEKEDARTDSPEGD